MAQQTIDNGTFTGDPSAEEIRVSFDKTNSNFTELYAGLGLGGSILTIDQPISMVGATQGESESKQVADAITARTNDFTIPLGSIPIVSSYLPYITGDNATAYVQKNTFILNTGDGTYGATGSITLDASNVIKINKEKEIIKPDTVIDMGDIGATALSTAVNNASPSNTKLGLTLVTAIQSGVIQNYIFDAANGDYGSGDLQTSSDNFIDLNAEPDLSRNISDNAKEPIVRSIDITIGVEDLGRTNVFSQNNSAIVVDTDVNLFIENGSTFLVQFTGNGTHTMVIPSTTESLTSYKKYDIVLVQKVSTNNWFATRLGETEDPVLPLTNVVHINNAADFPAPVGGVIELVPSADDNITYVIAAANIDMGSDRFTVTNGNIVIRGSHKTGSEITTTNATTLFTCEDSNLFLEFINIDCPSAKVLDFTKPVAPLKSLSFDNVIIRECDSVATIDGAFTTSLRTSTIVKSNTGGFLWTGTTNNQINISKMYAAEWTGTLLDLGTATFDIIDMGTGNRFISPVGTTILSGMGSSGNFNVGGRGIITGNLLNGSGTALVGIDTEDLQWTFDNNIFADNSTKNTEAVVDTYLTATETVTISSAGVYYPIGGTDWSSDITKRFTVSTGGEMTYIGLETIDVLISTVSTVSKVGGGSDIICSKIAVNGTVSDKTISCTENTQPTSIASQGLFELATGDTIQLYVANNDSTSNVIVDASNVVISRRV